MNEPRSNDVEPPGFAKLGRVGRADLVWSLKHGNASSQDVVARMVGFERKVEVEPPPLPRAPRAPRRRARPVEPPAPAPVAETFWQPTDYQVRVPLEIWRPSPTRRNPRPPLPLGPRIGFPPLDSPAAIATRVLRVSALLERAGDLDVERIVQRLGRGEALRRFPRLPRRRWAPRSRLSRIVAAASCPTGPTRPWLSRP